MGEPVFLHRAVTDKIVLCSELEMPQGARLNPASRRCTGTLALQRFQVRRTVLVTSAPLHWANGPCKSSPMTVKDAASDGHGLPDYYRRNRRNTG